MLLLTAQGLRDLADALDGLEAVTKGDTYIQTAGIVVNGGAAAGVTLDDDGDLVVAVFEQ